MQETSKIYHPATYPDNHLIRFIWQAEKVDCGDEKEKILPKGTAEIIFNLSSNTRVYQDSETTSFDVPKCMINGLNIAPYHLIKADHQVFVGIQLQSFALKYLFGIPIQEFTNQVLNGFDVCKSLERLYEKLAAAENFDARVQCILTWFRQKLMIDHRHLDTCTIFDLYKNPDIKNQSVRSLSNTYNMTDRHLRRLSKDYLGMKAGDFILYSKYLGSLMSLHRSDRSLTEIAYECGFYDQSHFIREFKALTGLTPGQYRKQMSALPGHIFFR